MKNIKIGEVLSNDDLYEHFKCGNMGGMRRSKKTNTLVVISDHTKGLYDDKWYGDILHYTGMGKKGNQSLKSQNETLSQSPDNGVDIHLFEVMKAKEYTYCGIVELVEAPYIEEQKDEDGLLRNVWMFPLKCKENSVILDRDVIENLKQNNIKKAVKLDEKELEIMAKERSTNKTSNRQVINTAYLRDEYIAEYAKVRAKGICQLCESKAPFCTPNGRPYLESHHIVWLSV